MLALALLLLLRTKELTLSMKLSALLIVLLLLPGFNFHAQLRTTNWNEAGYRGAKPLFTQTVNIMTKGGNTSGGPNNAALASAISALGGRAGVIYFPAGVYTFTASVTLNRDSILFLGDGHGVTRLQFNMNGTLNHCINIVGTEVNADTSSFTTPCVRDSSRASVINASKFKAGDWVYLQCNDSAYMASTWAYRSLGQVMQVKTVNGNQLTFYSPFRFNYVKKLRPVIKRMLPRKVIGFECLALKRMDPTTFQTSLLAFDRAVQCWAHGIEGDSTNYAHMEFNRSSSISVTNSWFHHAHGYGGSGQGYGLVFQYSAGEILAENNVFEHLRHSMLFQAGANGNVAAYNYSFDPFWVQGFFPPNSAGDIVFHGNFPFLNLVEGNIHQNGIVDNSHGINGPYNTFFRNRMELYGFVMNSGAGDTLQFIANEITNTTQLMGNYSITGGGHLLAANLVKGVSTPANSASQGLASLYLSGQERPACFNAATNNWPMFGELQKYNTGFNAAYERVQRNVRAECDCSFSIPTGLPTHESNKVLLFPNPSGGAVKLISPSPGIVSIYTTDGELIYRNDVKENLLINEGTLRPGCYLVLLDGQTVSHSKLIILNNSR
jgi:hypothetical protein